LNQIITTSDGSHTIYVPELDEHYHSVHGAVQESSFIFIDCGFQFCKADPLNILEVGFGTGLNALLTAIKSIDGERQVNYTSIEKYPVDKEIIDSRRIVGLAKGFGFRNYWAGSIYNVMKTWAIQ